MAIPAGGADVRVYVLCDWGNIWLGEGIRHTYKINTSTTKGQLLLPSVKKNTPRDEIDVPLALSAFRDKTLPSVAESTSY